MCPAHDRSAEQKDIEATFYMTNIVPQSPASNQRGWERLEDYCRTLAKRGHELYVVCGPHGVGGEGGGSIGGLSLRHGPAAARSCGGSGHVRRGGGRGQGRKR